MFKRKREYLIPVLGFLFIILVGAIILYLPCCTIGTANFNNPFVMPEIISELSKYMEENNIETLDEIRGIVG